MKTTLTKQDVLNLMSKGIKTYKGVKLPTSQKSGTYTQQTSYNNMVAQKFIDNTNL